MHALTAKGIACGALPFRKIAEELTLRGLTPKRGGTWHPQQVRELLLLAQIPGPVG